MPKKNNLLSYRIINAGSLGGNITSAVTNIQFLDNIALQMIWSAGSTPIGTFSVEGSLDYAQDTSGNVQNAGNWTAITISPSPAVSGNSGSWLLDLNQLSFPWIRLKYTRASGSGTLNAYISGKEV